MSAAHVTNITAVFLGLDRNKRNLTLPVICL